MPFTLRFSSLFKFTSYTSHLSTSPWRTSKFLTVSEERVQKVLGPEASGPDNVPNWLLKEYSDILAFPITQILNASYREQRLPTIWKMADVPPLPKKKPVLDLKKDLRPISLTPCVSKVAEEFVVEDVV